MNWISNHVYQSISILCHHILCNRNLVFNFSSNGIYPFDDRRIKSDLRTIFVLIKNMIKNEFTKRIAQGNSIILAISPPTIALVSREKKNPVFCHFVSQHFALGISILSRRSLLLHLGQALNL